MSLIVHRHRALLDALEPFIAAGGEEAVAAAGESLDDAQRSINDLARPLIDSAG